jgi:hypothetical protein
VSSGRGTAQSAGDADAWRRRVVAACELALERLRAHPEQEVGRLVADIASLRDRLVHELSDTALTSTPPDKPITVVVDRRQGGRIAAVDLNDALVSLASDLNSATVGAIGSALRNAVDATMPELALTETQAIALLAQIRHARWGEPLTPLGAAISLALRR